MSDHNFLDAHNLNGAFLSTKLLGLVDVIAEQGNELLQQTGIIIPSRTVSCVLLVGDKGGVSAADIAKALHQPHQLATQRIEALIHLGLLERSSDPNDGRRKILVLTKNGKNQYKRLNLRLKEVEHAFLGLFKEIDCDLADAAEKALCALTTKSMLDRIAESKQSKPSQSRKPT